MTIENGQSDLQADIIKQKELLNEVRRLRDQLQEKKTKELETQSSEVRLKVELNEKKIILHDQ